MVTLARIAATSGVLAYVASATFQLYRSLAGTDLDVDRFTPGMAIVYLLLITLSVALFTDRRWLWWVNGLVSAAVFLQAPFGYYPYVYDARALEVWDWLEGTWFTALLFLVATCAVLRLSGWRLVRES